MKRKLNFWILLHKLSLFAGCVGTAYVFVREVEQTGTFSGVSFIVPLCIVIYCVIMQAIESVPPTKKDKHNGRG